MAVVVADEEFRQPRQAAIYDVTDADLRQVVSNAVPPDEGQAHKLAQPDRVLNDQFCDLRPSRLLA